MISLYLKRIILTINVLLISTSLYAQNMDQSDSIGNYSNLRHGQTVDEYGNGINGVRVQVKGTHQVTETDKQGYFTIQAPVSSILVFKHPSFNIRELKIRLNSRYLVSGKVDTTSSDSVDANNLNDVSKQITATQRTNVEDIPRIKLTRSYYNDSKRVDMLYESVPEDEILGSVSTVYTNQLKTTPSALYAAALPGRLAGLYTQKYSGFRSVGTSGTVTPDFVGNVVTSHGNAVPSDNSQISLNLRGHSPVTIIDGVQRNIYSLDATNIESISVLKDPLSSLMLGMRSSRGVLLVTTKKPEKGDLQFSFTAQTGVQQPLRLPDPLEASEYTYLVNEAYQSNGQDPIYDQETYNALKNGTSPYLHPNVHWYDKALRNNSPISSAKLNVSGGGDVAQYNVNLNYFDQEGMFNTSGDQNYNQQLDYKRYILDSNVNVDVSRNFNVALQILGRIQNGNQPGAGKGTILNDIYRTPNNAYSIYNPDGSYGGSNTYTRNIMAEINDSGYLSDNTRDALVNVKFHYDMDKVLEGLSAKAITNYSTQAATYINRSRQNKVFEYHTTEQGDTTYTERGNNSSQSNSFTTTSNSSYWYSQFALNYENNFGKHNVGGLLMADRRSVTLNYDLPGISANYGAKGRYNYDKKYFAEGAVDYSGYNRYPPDNQYGLFYAFGLGWDIARENFAQNNLPWLNQFKLRGTYGKTGNGINNSGYYIWRHSYHSIFEAYAQGNNRARGDGFVEDGLSNPNITWEKAHKLDVGLDAKLFDNHLSFSGDYYHDKYYDLLQTRGKSIELVGIGYPRQNIGRNLRKGLELSLKYQNNAGNFNYFVSGNWSRRKTKVLYQDEQNRQYDYQYRTGRPIGTRFGYIADGFYQSQQEIENSATYQDPQPGDVKYVDVNNDGTVDQFDQVPIGGQKPLSFFGLTAGFSYRGFDVSVLIQGVYNRENYRALSSFPNGIQGQAYGYIKNRWTPENAETATYPRLSTGTNYRNIAPGFITATSFWQHSGNYVRLKNVSVKYTFPLRWAQKAGLSELSLFVHGFNLYTISGYDRVDPEINSFTSYPNQRVVSTGINIKL